MPREVIHQPQPQPGEIGQAFRLAVGWDREAGHVQIGVETVEQSDGQHHLIDQIYGDAPTLTAIGRTLIARLRDYDPAEHDGESLIGPVDFKDSDTEAQWYAGVGRDVLDAVTGSTPFGTSVWVTVGRRAVNDLIRVVRRARDAAFGKDE